MEKETPVNALREVLRAAIDKLKPEGDRQYTNEWILYNLLDFKIFIRMESERYCTKIVLI